MPRHLSQSYAIERRDEADGLALPLREKTTFGTDDGGNVHKLNETKKLNQAMVPVTLIQGLRALPCIILL